MVPRELGLDAIATGVMTVPDLKNSLAATRALLLGTVSPSPVPEAPAP
jgi:hypothetical protein